jgi:hypothetical protein
MPSTNLGRVLSSAQKAKVADHSWFRIEDSVVGKGLVKEAGEVKVRPSGLFAKSLPPDDDGS